MNSHKNARLTFVRRRELVLDVLQRGLTQGAAAAAHGVSVPTVRKWVGRYLADGEAGLADRSSRPQRSPRAIAPATALAIVELRRRRLTQARIAASLGVSKSTVGRVLARAGLSRLSDLEPAEPIVRYEHAHPGDLVHIDTKKLGRIERLGHRISGDRRDTVDGAGWEFLFVAVDDRARLGVTAMHPDERQASAVRFLRATVADFARFGVRGAARADRQRLGVPLQGLRQGLPAPGHQAQLHPPLPTADQRQSRALHPVGPARMGLRHRLPPLRGARRHARALDPPLQLAPPPPRHRWPRTHQPPGSAQ